MTESQIFALRRAIDYFGSQGNLARATGVSQPRLTVWLANRAKKGIPAEVCIAIERATNGAVQKHDLRPDLWNAEQA